LEGPGRLEELLRIIYWAEYGELVDAGQEHDREVVRRTFSHMSWLSNAQRVKKGLELTPKARRGSVVHCTYNDFTGGWYANCRLRCL
ncbi:MAG: hypothetical protein LBT11_07355, partial [Treponema sp.]|nr:hypothetical protein [Treponema sp.]